MKSFFQNYRFWVRVVICLIISILPLGEFEKYAYDFKFKIRGNKAPDPQILIIETDSDEFATLKKLLESKKDYASSSYSAPELVLRDIFLWDSEVYASLLKTLLEKEPKSILISFYYSDSLANVGQNSEQISLFKNPKIKWASSFDDEGRFNLPAKNLISATNFGFNNIPLDKDGIVRFYNSHMENQDSLIKNDLLSLKKSNFLINFKGYSGSFYTCKIWDFLSENKLKPECSTLKNKTIIIGRSINNFNTPFGYMSRSEVLANAISTIKNNDQIHESNFEIKIVTNIFLIFCIAIIISYFSTFRSIFYSSIVLVSTITINQLLFVLFIFHLPMLTQIIAIFSSYFMFSALKMAHKEDSEWLAKKEAEYLKNLDQMKSNFLSLISHDLKTPIAKIQAITERLKKEKDLANHLEHFESIEKSNDELKNYILNILNLSKIENSSLVLNKKSNDINLLIEEQIARLKFFAQRKSINIETDLEPMFALEFDEDLIKQVISNLIDNAIKYSPENSVIKIKSYEEQNMCTVEVIDNGEGIPQDKLDLLFKKFSRLTPYTGDSVKGTGLGLYLSKFFIEMHGGEITVKPARLGGSRFIFNLPI